MPSLMLYVMSGCPYCRKVQTYLQSVGISVPVKDTMATPTNRAELRRIGGKTQVPCLVIDGKALYESDDIIRWFQENGKR